jgi:hypothetical protein
LVSDKSLGLIKLEYGLQQTIFLSPKVYSLLIENYKINYKVKGISQDIKFTLEDLLFKKGFVLFVLFFKKDSLKLNPKTKSIDDNLVQTSK